MTFTRRDAWLLNTDLVWPPTLEWYARAVRAMQARPLEDPLSWRYQAAIHGLAATGRALERMSARQLVLPAVAPDVPLPVRANRTEGHPGAWRAGRLGAAVLELRGLRPLKPDSARL